MDRSTAFAPLRFSRVCEERLADLMSFLTAERWEYFGRPDMTEERVRASWDAGDYRAPGCEGFFIEDDRGAVVGLIRLFDLEDDNVLFDIRLTERVRGRGFGTTSVRWIVDHLFARADIVRIDANTRHDNVAMRATLRRCGFVKEGHHRAARADGHDSVSYALLRRDWESGTTTPVRWDDAPDIDAR